MQHNEKDNLPLFYNPDYGQLFAVARSATSCQRSTSSAPRVDGIESDMPTPSITSQHVLRNPEHGVHLYSEAYPPAFFHAPSGGNLSITSNRPIVASHPRRSSPYGGHHPTPPAAIQDPYTFNGRSYCNVDDSSAYAAQAPFLQAIQITQSIHPPCSQQTVSDGTTMYTGALGSTGVAGPSKVAAHSQEEARVCLLQRRGMGGPCLAPLKHAELARRHFRNEHVPQDLDSSCPWPECNKTHEHGQPRERSGWSRDGLIRHLMGHSGLLKQLCLKCDKYFSRGDSLRRHIKRIHGSKESNKWK